jgi:acyl-CoA synthetase (AMP-forming)/AMP-acid ligase II
MIYTSPYPSLPAQFAPMAGTVPHLVPHLVYCAAGRSPDHPAIVDASSGAVVSYAALAGQIDRVAAGLARRGFAPGGVLALRAPNTPAWAAVALGAMAAGGAVTGVSPLATEAEAAAHVASAPSADGGAATLVTDPGSLVTEPGSLVTEPGFLAAQRGPLTPPGIAVEPGQLALLPFSSSTTGLPKPVMLSHANLTAAARQLATGLALTPRDRFLALAPLAHVMGFVVSLCAPLAAGATVVMLPRFELAALLDAIQRHRVTVIAVPPPVLAALARDPAVSRYDLSAVEALVSGGAPVSPELQAEAAGRFPGAMIGQGYGLTETSAVIPVPDRAGMLPGSVGRLGPGTELRLLDPDTGRDARPGEPGELCVRGPQVMAGYLGRPEATAQMLGSGGWLRTGDLGRVDPGGHLFIVDRLKELIKVNAIQVAPAELEALLAGHPQVADVAVVPRPDERTGEAPVAFVVARGPLEPGQLIAWVAARVAPHKRIRAVRLVREIPRTPSGKILRRLLVEADRAELAGAGSGQPR